MLYRLLRNNKESGPYTALQLKEMGLKPYDLLWTEGRGAAWQYASEIAELKSFAPTVEEQPFDRFYKKNEPETVAQQQPAIAEKKAKPRFRISGDKIVMVEAGNMEVAKTGVIKETTQTRLPQEPVVAEKVLPKADWQNMYPEWQPETKAVPATAKKEEPVEIETKYKESLDDLKKRYAEKVLNDKNEKKSPAFSSSAVKQNATAAIALVVLMVGGYVGYTLKQKDTKAVTDGKPAVERADVLSDNSLSNEAATETSDAANNSQASSSVQPENNLEKNTETTKKLSPVETAKPETKLPINTPDKKEAKVDAGLTAKAIADKKLATGKSSNGTVVTKSDVPPTTTAAQGATLPVPAPVVSKPAVKETVQKKIDDYVAVKKVGGSTNAVENVRLLVTNVTDFPIDLAVVDIQYFDNKGRFQKGETMYVKNIDGGNNVEVRVPDSEKSSSIKYKVSLVSSEKKTLYLVAD